MEREIKFRGITLFGKEFVYGSLIIDTNEKGEKVYIIRRIESGKVSNFEVKEETVGQYTGLKDKNGVEIYEGDILQITTESGKWITKVGNHGIWHEILVNDSDIDLEYISINYAYDFLDCEIKIIGNIYENHLLIEV